MNNKANNAKLKSGNYFLLLLNDNVNSISDVVFALNEYAGMDLKIAYNVGMTAHQQGNSIITTGSLQKIIKIQKQLKVNKLTTRVTLIHGGTNWN